MAGLVVVGLVPDDLQLLPHLLGAHRHAVDRVLFIRHLGLAGHMLVGDQVRLSVHDPVRKTAPVDERPQVRTAQFSVAAVIDALVGRGVADGEDERLAGRVEDR